MRRTLWLVLLVGLLSCGDESPTRPQGPDPGPLDIGLDGAAGAGAVLMLVEGGPIDSVVALSYFTAHTPHSAVARRVLVAGSSLNGALARIMVPDRRVLYQARIIQIADEVTYQLGDSSAYTLTVEKP